jgi:hypothetical protein
MDEIADAKPLLLAVVNNTGIRLYPSPLDGPDFAWADIGDLQLALAIPEEVREAPVTFLVERHPEHARRLPSGRVLVSDVAASGLMLRLEEAGIPVGSFRAQYEEQVVEAFCIQHARLSPDEFKRIAMMAAARHASGAGHA